MNSNKKVMITVLVFVLAMVAIACSCSDIFPPPDVNPMPGLEGTWTNEDTGDAYEIAWQDGKYVVTSCTWGQDSYEITSQSWTDNSLTWSYYDTYFNTTVTVTTISLNGDYLDVNLENSGGSSGSATLQRGGVAQVTPGDNLLTSPDSLTVTSAETQTLFSGSGVSITIPAGAVPSQPDGSIGSITFRITQDTSTVPELPGGYIPVGPVVDLQPDGFVFEHPVTISIPIYEGVDPATVMGASYYDQAQGVWVLIPGSVDLTTRTVQVSSIHLSLYTAWGLVPQMPVDNVNYGWLSIARPEKNLPYGGPVFTYRGAHTTHTVCIKTANFTYPQEGNLWASADSLEFSVDNYWGSPEPDMREAFGLYRIPTGSYQLIEIIFQGEINPGDPDYIPQSYTMWRDYGPVAVAGGQTVDINFPYEASFSDTEWYHTRPACWGTPTPLDECVQCLLFPTLEPVPPTSEPLVPTLEPVPPIIDPNDMTPEQECACVDRYFREGRFQDILQDFKDAYGDKFISFDLAEQVPFTYNPSTGMCEGHYAYKKCYITDSDPNYCWIESSWGDNPGALNHEPPSDAERYMELYNWDTCE